MPIPAHPALWKLIAKASGKNIFCNEILLVIHRPTPRGLMPWSMAVKGGENSMRLVSAEATAKKSRETDRL